MFMIIYMNGLRSKREWLKIICSNKATTKERLMINKIWSNREILRGRGGIFVLDLIRC